MSEVYKGKFLNNPDHVKLQNKVSFTGGDKDIIDNDIQLQNLKHLISSAIQWLNPIKRPEAIIGAYEGGLVFESSKYRQGNGLMIELKPVLNSKDELEYKLTLDTVMVHYAYDHTTNVTINLTTLFPERSLDIHKMVMECSANLDDPHKEIFIKFLDDIYREFASEIDVALFLLNGNSEYKGTKAINTDLPEHLWGHRDPTDNPTIDYNMFDL